MKTQKPTDVIPSISVAVMLCSRSLTELIDIPFASIILLLAAIIVSLIYSKKEILLNTNITAFIIYILFFSSLE